MLNPTSRATVALRGAETLWFNTGTLCNIECVNCYIASSPKNDALVYITADEVRDYLDQIEERSWPVREIAAPLIASAPSTIVRPGLALAHDIGLLRYRVIAVVPASGIFVRGAMRNIGRTTTWP